MTTIAGRRPPARGIIRRVTRPGDVPPGRRQVLAGAARCSCSPARSCRSPAACPARTSPSRRRARPRPAAPRAGRRRGPGPRRAVRRGDRRASRPPRDRAGRPGRRARGSTSGAAPAPGRPALSPRPRRRPGRGLPRRRPRPRRAGHSVPPRADLAVAETERPPPAAHPAGVRAKPELARLLASVAGCEAAHAALLADR